MRSISKRYGARPRTGPALRPGPALRLAARSFRREPATALAAVVTLALGIGAATTIFAVLHGFGRSLPVPEGDRIVRIRTVDLRYGTELPVGTDALLTWASRVGALEAVGAYRTSSSTVVTRGSIAFQAGAAELSPEVLPLLRVNPELGRLPSQTARGEPLELAVGEELWRVHFDADPEVLGTSMEIDGRSAVLVGVMPASFGFPLAQDLWWVSPTIGRASRMDADSTSVAGPGLVARLAEGSSTAAASAQLGVRFARYHDTVAPGDDVRPAVRVLGFTEERGEAGEKVVLLALLGLVILLVLVSCANVANLLHSRSVRRAHVLTVHAALGAGPGQVALQVLGETFILAAAGGALGLLGGWCASRYIESTLSANWGYHWMRVGIDTTVVLFTTALVLIVAVVAGIAPALRARRLDLVRALKTRTAHEEAYAGWVSTALLGAQVAFSATALVAATLMVTGLLRMGRAAGDLPSDEILIASVTLDPERYPEPFQRAELRERLHTALGRTGASETALTTGIPGFRGETVAVEVEGSEGASGAGESQPLVSGVSPGFFDAFDLEMLRGRRLSLQDASSLDPVAIVTADFARHRLPAGDAIGARLRLGGGVRPDSWVRVVGVVESPGGEDAPREWIYVPIESRDPTTFFLVLRARSGGTHRLEPALRQAVRAVDPELPLDRSMLGTSTYTLGQILDYVQRFYHTTGTLALIGAMGAVLVALLGLYGVLSLDVGQRIREMGIRMALGAERSRVVSHVVARGLLRVVPGLLLGLLLAWLVTPAFGLFLAGAEPREPLVFVFAAGLYLLGTLAAAGSPALRAARADPAEVLRDE